MTAPLLEARDLVRHFNVGGSLFKRGAVVRAVDGVSLTVAKGETFAIVGESGCGKSTLARMLMQLLPQTSGEVLFNGQDISNLKGAASRKVREQMQFVFQDPFSSLNPRLTVRRLLEEPLEVHRPDQSSAERSERVAELLSQVGLLADHANRYPHEFSGGQRQRIGIARALASRPQLIIADEPVSALDVSVQAQVINLLGDLSRDLGLTLLIIAHDLAVIRHMSDRVAVMYLGQIVETGQTDALFATPRHPYTRALLNAIPDPAVAKGQNVQALSGEIPSPASPPEGCRFHTRCPHARALCRTKQPELQDRGGHATACHFWEQIQTPPDIRQSAAHTPGAAARFALYQAATEGGRVIHKTRPKEKTTERTTP